ncbi:MAG: hypothetical protein IK118_08400, partial [Clostridia bacterium]|nr:hypothetical protein [Clostridia bacterium]
SGAKPKRSGAAFLANADFCMVEQEDRTVEENGEEQTDKSLRNLMDRQNDDVCPKSRQFLIVL